MVLLGPSEEALPTLWGGVSGVGDVVAAVAGVNVVLQDIAGKATRALPTTMV
jgi:hypothetical protein